jgi:1,4-alpha-glucan branching enzyme
MGAQTMNINTSRDGYTIKVHVPRAKEVCVMGRFNNWSTVATPLRHLGNWVWQVTLPLEAELSDMRFFIMNQGEFFGRMFRPDQIPQPAVI